MGGQEVKVQGHTRPKIDLEAWRRHHSRPLQVESLIITGSAVALHCCKAHAKMNRKIENSTPCKIVTHEHFNLKLGTRDYVADITHHATLGSNRPSGGFPPNRGNITPVRLFWLYCTVALIVTLNGSNDVFPPKDGPFGVRTMGDVIWGKYSPKTPQKGA